MVTGGDIRGSNYKEYFYGVVNIDIVRIYLFLQYINDLEVDESYVGNAYLYNLPRIRYTLWQALILVNEKEMSLFV